MEATHNGGTYGKRLVGIMVTDENGNRITFGKSMIRNLTKIISYIAVELEFIWVLFHKEKKDGTTSSLKP